MPSFGSKRAFRNGIFGIGVDGVRSILGGVVGHSNFGGCHWSTGLTGRSKKAGDWISGGFSVPPLNCAD
eukprot:1971492-Rhodomonas_salina.4